MARTSPNPAYIFLPMFIAENLTSPQTARKRADIRELTDDLAVSVKIKFDDLCSFFRRGKVLPFFHSVLACLDQQWMSANYARAAYVPIRRDDDFDFDFAGHVHPARQLGIGRRSFCLDLALSIVRVRLLRGCA